MNFSRIKVVLVVVAVGSVVLGSAWLYAQQRRGTSTPGPSSTGGPNTSITGTFGPTGADPAYIVVSTSTPVLFTSQITDRQLKKRSVILVRLDLSGQPSDILGRLKDDGRNGDLKANDNIYSLRVILNESALGLVSFQVAARFKPGRWREPESDDDDWDKELSTFNRTTRDRPAERERFKRLFNRFARYTFTAPIQVTVDPFLLPPDPGEAGKQTLQGIDSDADGVRDDVQRWIGVSFHNSSSTLMGLMQLARAFEKSIYESVDKPSSIDRFANYVRAWNCLRAIRPGDADALRRDLEPIVLNTGQRVLADNEAGKHLHGTALPRLEPGGIAAACDF